MTRQDPRRDRCPARTPTAHGHQDHCSGFDIALSIIRPSTRADVGALPLFHSTQLRAVSTSHRYRRAIMHARTGARYQARRQDGMGTPGRCD